MTPFLIANEDLQPLLDEVSRFSNVEIRAATSRPETPTTVEELIRLSHAALELGILPSDGPEPDYALWAQPEDTNAIAFSIGALRQIASVNAGIALAWHRNALAHFLARSVGFQLSPEQQAPLALTTIPTGHYGLARGALIRWLNNAANHEDLALLADWLDRHTRKTTFAASPQWQSVIWLEWQNSHINWTLINRNDVTASSCRPQHGVDELSTWQITAAPNAGTALKATSQQVSAMLILDTLGLLAIATGINEHGKALAQAYASQRHQGGRPIHQHPAIQTMLATMEQAQYEAMGTLSVLTKPVSQLSLKHLMMARFQLHPKFCLAADLVMQLHGGIGYMQDCGPEKLLRDQNMLRLQSGGIREIPLSTHAWGKI